LPPVLRWLTGNIGVHHIHHVSARIPFYKLREVLKHDPALKDVNRLGMLESIPLRRPHAVGRSQPAPCFIRPVRAHESRAAACNGLITAALPQRAILRRAPGLAPPCGRSARR
jgi:hypothetical protein